MPSPISTRRDFLRSSITAGSALATSVLAARLLPTSTAKDDAETIKVGVLHSLTGTVAIPEATLKDAELLAIEEINKAGGVLGKKIEPVVEDPQSKFTDVFPEKAKKLLVKDKVVAVFGCWTSVSRKNVKPIFEENNGLLFYPARYEGDECSKNVIYGGSTPNQLVMPAVEYLWDKMNKRKFYLLGTDYIFPRTSFMVAKALLKQKHESTPVKEQYVSFGHQTFEDIVKDIQSSKADVVLSALVGDSMLHFFKALKEAQVKAVTLPVCSLLLDEDELRFLDPELVEGHLAASSYFQSVDTPENKRFVKSFQARYGKTRVTDDVIETAYTQVYLWKQAVETAKSVEVDKVREALKDLEFKAPGGTIKADGKNQHTWKPFRVGKIGSERQFTIVHTSELIQPEPYPQVAFPGWGCDWTKGGPIQGKRVEMNP